MGRRESREPPQSLGTQLKSALQTSAGSEPQGQALLRESHLIRLIFSAAETTWPPSTPLLLPPTTIVARYEQDILSSLRDPAARRTKGGLCDMLHMTLQLLQGESYLGDILPAFGQLRPDVRAIFRDCWVTCEVARLETVDQAGPCRPDTSEEMMACSQVSSLCSTRKKSRSLLSRS